MTQSAPDAVSIIKWDGGLGVELRYGPRHEARGMTEDDWPLLDQLERAGTLKIRGDDERLKSMFQHAHQMWCDVTGSER